MRASKVAARLDGTPPDALDGRIFLTDVRELAPKIKLSTAARPMGGLRMTRREMQSRSVALRFVIWERDRQERSRIFAKLAQWAEGGGWLSISARDAQRLKVVCEKLPELESKAWDSEMEISLISYAPDWESVDAISGTALLQAGVAQEIILRPDGTARETPLMMDITCESGVLRNVRVQAGEKAIVLNGLALSAGQRLTMAEEDGYLRITAAGESALQCRSAESADRIMLKQRDGNRVQLLTDAPARAVLRARARWI